MLNKPQKRLRPCKICGSKKSKVIITSHGYCVVCKACNASTPLGYESTEEACDAWNLDT